MEDVSALSFYFPYGMVPLSGDVTFKMGYVCAVYIGIFHFVFSALAA